MRGEETSPAQQSDFETTPVVDARSARRNAAPCDNGFTEFVTGYVSRPKWSGNEKKLTLRLFPSYLFRRFKLSDLGAILNRFGVISAGSTGNQPAVLGDGDDGVAGDGVVFVLRRVFAQTGPGERPKPCCGPRKSVKRLVVAELRKGELWTGWVAAAAASRNEPASWRLAFVR